MKTWSNLSFEFSLELSITKMKAVAHSVGFPTWDTDACCLVP